jgi:outer membrane immunogenic protein
MLNQRLAALVSTAARRRLSVAAALALPLSAAAAQDPAPQPPADIAPHGLRIELLAGLDDDFFEQGTLYGGRVGYDFRVGRKFSLGLDAELTETTVEQTISFASGPLTVDDGPDGYVGGRATFAISRRFRIHGAGGYTRARHGYFTLASDGSIVGRDVIQDGFRLSAGAQFSLGRKAFIGAEYRYSEYDSFFKRDQYVATIGFRF